MAMRDPLMNQWLDGIVAPGDQTEAQRAARAAQGYALGQVAIQRHLKGAMPMGELATRLMMLCREHGIQIPTPAEFRG
jgi:hypothetical protein